MYNCGMSQIKLSEHNEQATFVTAIRWQYRNDPTFYPELFFAVPNGFWAGGSSKQGRFALIQKYKQEGFAPGIADVHYLAPRGPYAHLAIEMKSAGRRNEKNGGATQEQLDFLTAVNKAGGLGVICYGCQEAIDAFDKYMALPVIKRRGGYDVPDVGRDQG